MILTLGIALPQARRGGATESRKIQSINRCMTL
jgi:hypothetical protein